MRALRLLLPAMLLALSLSQSVRAAEYDEGAIIEQARSHYQKGDYYFAATWFERALNKYPRTSQREDILVMIAKCYALTWREDKAIQTMRTLRRHYPKGAERLDPAVLKLADESAYGYDENGPELWGPPPPLPVAAAPAPVPDSAPLEEKKAEPAVVLPRAGASASPALSVLRRVREKTGLGASGMEAALQARAREAAHKKPSVVKPAGLSTAARKQLKAEPLPKR